MKKNSGFQPDDFDSSLKRSFSYMEDPNFSRFEKVEDYKKAVGDYEDKEDYWPRLPGSSDTGDPYSHIIKPHNVPYWDKVPSTDEEKAIYYGLHIHSETNPFGLHSHVIGGKLSGAHNHGPNNRFGVHTHKESDPSNPMMMTLDGKHLHETGVNMPCGSHSHDPNLFG